ncbi:MAG: hypothetical protein IKK32_06685 [Oscillospiraceae bacterium]|nr:hypothetical protein [Oscillospiraceae bacterium]MBR4093537.1 hypothetical protein [Oscillospiraceae bacterium]
MKKRILSAILAAMTAITFTACSKDTPDTPDTSVTDSPAVTDSVSQGGETANNRPEVPRFVYNSLPDEEKAIYDKILTGIYNYETEVDLGAEYPVETVLKTYKNVFFQEPEIFWFYATNEQFMSAQGTMSTVSLQYRYDEHEIEPMKKELESKLKEIESMFPENATDIDKIITIHDYIITNTVFSKDDVHSRDAYGPLAGGYAQCEGYAKGLAYACNYFGIENVRITGNKYDNNSHAWTKVKIDGKWYNADVTWDDPESSNGEQLLRHNYLFVPDAVINDITHIVICDFEPPVADSTDVDYFKYKGLYANTKEEAVSLLHDHIVEQAKKGETVCQVKCANEEVYRAALDELIQKGGHQKISEDAKAQNPQFSSFGLMNDDQLFIIHFNIKYN